jgi:hypothetical protein
MPTRRTQSIFYPLQGFCRFRPLFFYLTSFKIPHLLVALPFMHREVHVLNAAYW